MELFVAQHLARAALRSRRRKVAAVIQSRLSASFERRDKSLCRISRVASVDRRRVALSAALTRLAKWPRITRTLGYRLASNVALTYYQLQLDHCQKRGGKPITVNAMPPDPVSLTTSSLARRTGANSWVKQREIPRRPDALHPHQLPDGAACCSSRTTLLAFADCSTSFAMRS